MYLAFLAATRHLTDGPNYIKMLPCIYMNIIIVLVILCVFIMLCCVCCVHKSEWFGVNAGYYLAGDGSWAGQMAPATIDKDGSTGLVPAPLLGQNDSYLRGDGKWIRANNAPTAAQYLHVIHTGGNSTLGKPLDFSRVLADTGGGAITLLTPFTDFVLAPNYTYKLTCHNNYMSSNDNGGPFQWQNSTSGALIGIAGNFKTLSGTYLAQGPAIAYISPTVTTTVRLYGISTTNGASATSLNGEFGSTYGTGTGDAAGYLAGLSAIVEVVSNNNTITAFSGATPSSNGFGGYIPQPLAGQQNYVLTGAGNWAPQITALTPVKLTGTAVLFSNIPGSARRVTVMLADVGISGPSQVRLRLGAGSIVATGYTANAMYTGAGTSNETRTDGFCSSANTSSLGDRRNGAYTLSHLGNNTWVCTAHFDTLPGYNTFCAGRVTLPGVLDRVNLSITDAADTFITGTANVMYE